MKKVKKMALGGPSIENPGIGQKPNPGKLILPGSGTEKLPIGKLQEKPGAVKPPSTPQFMPTQPASLEKTSISPVKPVSSSKVSVAPFLREVPVFEPKKPGTDEFGMPIRKLPELTPKQKAAEAKDLERKKAAVAAAPPYVPPKGFNFPPVRTRPSVNEQNMKKGGGAKKYTNGGKINLGACGVSTHQNSKKSPNW